MDEDLKRDLIALLEGCEVVLQDSWGVRQLLNRLRELKERVVNS